jgi:hypothetical protein
MSCFKCQRKRGVRIIAWDDAGPRPRIRRSDNEHGGADDRRAGGGALTGRAWVDVAYGIPGVRANSPAELEAAIAEASARNVPTIIDTPITWTG